VRQAIIQIILIFFVSLLLFVDGQGGIQNVTWAELSTGLGVSLLSAMMCLFFFEGLQQKSTINSDDIVKPILKELSHLNHLYFGRVDRNVDMGDRYWIDCISELGNSHEPVWFVALA
jgi:hypothetical protein